MKKTIASALLCASALAACGGGGDSSPTASAKVATLSYYGNPLRQASTAAATSKGAVAHADAAGAASEAAAATVQTLTQTLAAQGVTATVTPQVMNGTTLHALIMGENNGLPPTNDQFKTDPNGWLVVNFQLDDMVTRRDDPAQVAALTQFQQDMTTFIQRAHVSGKLVFVVLPIPTCDVTTKYSAADGLIEAEVNAAGQATGYPVGTLPYTWVADSNGVLTNTYTQGHMGSDCRSPDAYLTSEWTNSIAAAIAPALKEGLK